MRIKVVAAFLGLVSAASSLVAAPNPAFAEGPPVIFGAGGVTCARYAQFYRRNPDRYGELFFQWSQGFMSATDMDRHINHAPILNLNPSAFPVEEQRTFMNKYCDEHPLRLWVDATQDLFSEIVRSESR